MLTSPDDGVEPTVVRALATVLAPLGVVHRVERLTGGMFATTYRVTLQGTRPGRTTRVVVKTAPTQTDRLLTHELDLVRTEAAVYRLAADRPDLLMPRVLLTDFTRAVLPSDVLVVTHLEGCRCPSSAHSPPTSTPPCSASSAPTWAGCTRSRESTSATPTSRRGCTGRAGPRPSAG
ncbi:phosphotransferase family protein [Actinotalea sp. K2]|uniref:phosphotransferase family protein n=1 Tax=Actinotalea sp. K2 TaxID=2939438 RepID=UPI002016DB83|nr:hypothetical protein [Actinotalea sp. K2]MCL3862475.1 hypothetical protein [Actinotalea sp. K2]